MTNKTALKIFSGRPVLRRLGILTIVVTAVSIMYAMAGFWLAPYLITRYVPSYATERLKIQLRLDHVRINPFLFTFEARDISLCQGGDNPILTLKRIYIDFEPSSLFSRRIWTFADLELEAPALNLVIGKDGRLNLIGLVEALAQSGGPQTSEKKTPPSLLLRHLALSNGTVHLVDRSKPSPVTFTIAPIAIEFKGISTLPEHCGTYTLFAKLPGGGALHWKGDLSLQPIRANGDIELKDFKPAVAWNFFRDRLNLAEPAGVAQLSAGYAFSYQNGKMAFHVSPINLTVRGLSLTEKDATQPILRVNALKASAGRLDLMKHQLVFPVITINDGMVTAMVDKAGIGNWQRLVKSTPQHQAPKVSAAGARPAMQNDIPWRIGVETLTITGLGVHYNDASRTAPFTLAMNLANLSLTKGGIDLGQQEAVIKRIALTGGDVIFTRAPANPLRTVETSTAPSQGGEEPAKEEARPIQGRPWKFALDQFTMAGFHIGFVDNTVNPIPTYDLIDLRAEVKDFRNNGRRPITFEARSQIQQGGSVGLAGTFQQPRGRIDARVTLSHLNLKPLQSLVAQYTTLTLVSGNLSTDTHLGLITGPRPTITVAGEAKIGRLLLNEADTGGRLLSWKELAVDGLDFSLNPDHLAINELSVLEPGAKIIIFKDKSLNLSKIGRSENQALPQARPDRQSAGPEAVKADRQRFPVAVERVRIENGVVDFADFSLVLPFATRIERCKGTAVGISTEPASRTFLKFEGRVGEFGQAKVEGSLAPFSPRHFTDIHVAFRNVVMPPLSPYSATFAGRKIASGKLNLDLEYNIKDSKLLGNNKVVLKDFTLGDRVKSPGAMDLPLDLAIALLTDNEGKIDIAVPISGNLDHPEFSYGHLIRQAVFNLLSRVVTSPFRALAALFGSHYQNLDAVLFEPGLADVSPPEQEKLKKVSEILAKRKQLMLIVHGGFDQDLDGAAIKSAYVRRTLAQKMGVKLEQDEDPGPVAYDNADTQRALESLAGSRVLATFQAEYEGHTGRKVRRVNPALALIGKAGEDSDFYQALFEYLVKTAPLPQTELQVLAEKRRTAIINELVTHDMVDPARLTPAAISQTKGLGNVVPSKLELGVH